MKRMLVVIISILFCLTLPLSASAAKSYPIVDTMHDTKMEQAVKDTYDLVPSGIRSSFEKKGWKIEITDIVKVSAISIQSGKLIPVGSYVAGVTATASKKIYLVGFCAASALPHEMGHFADFMVYGHPSGTKTFRDIYNAEKKLFDGGTNDYAQSAVEEYFAEAFSEYITCAGYLESKAPKTFKYMHNLIGGTKTRDVKKKPDEEFSMLGVIPTATLEKIAKEVADGVQKNLPDNIKKALPDVDEVLEKAKAGYEKIKEDPYKAGADAAEKVNDFLSNKDGKGFDPEKTGKEMADWLNKKIGGK